MQLVCDFCMNTVDMRVLTFTQLRHPSVEGYIIEGCIFVAAWLSS